MAGFADLGHLGRFNLSATSALVFMLRGLRSSWKQPIAYFLSHGSVKSADLAEFIRECLQLGGQVCDGAKTNESAANKLGVRNGQSFIIFENRKIFFGFDVPHLIKCIRNNLASKDFEIEGNLISWDALRELRNLEKHNVCRAATKLTDAHFDLNAFSKMNESRSSVQRFSSEIFNGWYLRW